MVTTPQDTPETIMAKAILYADKKIKEQANAIETLEERNQASTKGTLYCCSKGSLL